MSKNDKSTDRYILHRKNQQKFIESISIPNPVIYIAFSYSMGKEKNNYECFAPLYKSGKYIGNLKSNGLIINKHISADVMVPIYCLTDVLTKCFGIFDLMFNPIIYLSSAKTVRIINTEEYKYFFINKDLKQDLKFCLKTFGPEIRYYDSYIYPYSILKEVAQENRIKHEVKSSMRKSKFCDI